MIDRRLFLQLAAAAAAAAATAVAKPSPSPSPSSTPGGTNMHTRPIPKSKGGETLPLIGLGTWQTFDVGADAAARAPLAEVLVRFFAAGGRLIDSSPMYGRAESVVGDLLREQTGASEVFRATKVWTTGAEQGAEQMRESMRRMGSPSRIDLMQVHNLVDWKTQLASIRRMKEAGAVRYTGITHYQSSAFGDLEKIIREEDVDFVQLPYSVTRREVEKRLLPAAADHATAVIVMQPFESGGLFGKVRKTPLPGWAPEIDCTSWAQLFLKFIVSHPAVTCAIPATGNPEHLSDNVRAGMGRLPDEAQRRRIAGALEKA